MLLHEIRNMLTGTILPFWQSLRDDANGGYYGWVGFDLRPDPKAEKGCILNSRILWFFSQASVLLESPDLLDYATHAYRFMLDHCVDIGHGGMYWSLNYDGSVKDSSKHTYNQAFAVYALSAYYEASGDEDALQLAHELHELIEEKCTDGIGYGEAYDRCFVPASNEKLSENGVLADKTMNTLLHLLEGYAGLQQADPSAGVEASMRKILSLFQTKVYSPSLCRQEVFFDKDMNSLLDLHSYGHDIEAAWLLDWGAGLLDDRDLAGSIAGMTSSLAASVYRNAYHKHSVWNESENGEENKARVWWVQAEAMVGFMNEYQKNPEMEYYRRAVVNVWGFIKEYLVDKRAGSEWYWEVDDDGRPVEGRPIVEPWKCPYHNGRMCFELLRRNIDAAT